MQKVSVRSHAYDKPVYCAQFDIVCFSYFTLFTITFLSVASVVLCCCCCCWWCFHFHIWHTNTILDICVIQYGSSAAPTVLPLVTNDHLLSWCHSSSVKPFSFFFYFCKCYICFIKLVLPLSVWNSICCCRLWRCHFHWFCQTMFIAFCY